jgi:glycerate dehydrogenase
VERVKNADIIVVNKVKITKEVIDSAQNLKLICETATGYDNIDVSYCKKLGIKVTNTPAYSANSVAQVTISMACSLMTHLNEYQSFVHSGKYQTSGNANKLTPIYHELTGLTWGIIGFGNIGKQVGTVAKALGCRVIVNKRTPISDWDCVDLETICRESDILSIHTPLNEGTRGMLDESHIRMLKKNAIVINVARGAVTDEVALASAIKEGRIGGLGIDVYSVEPFPTTHPFYEIREYPNVCLTPHMAWGALEARQRCIHEMAENIKAFENGIARNQIV